MKKLLNNISKEISDDLNSYNEFLVASLNSKVSLINTILKYIIKFKGKQFRPMLCILCAKVAGSVNTTTFLSASTVEMLHVATLQYMYVISNKNDHP